MFLSCYENKIDKKGRVSVPQIFCYGKHIGGCDDLFNMESAGELDKALNIEID